MKTLVVAGLVLMIAFSGNDLIAQRRRAEAQDLRAAVAEDVRQAAKHANLKFDESLVVALADVGASQRPEAHHVYATVAKDVRVARLEHYLSAKAATKAGFFLARGLTGNDVSDFHWGYIARDVKYTQMRLQSPEPAALLSVESAEGSHVFAKTGLRIAPGEVILLPIGVRAADADVTATFEVSNAKTVWTGRPVDGGPLAVVAARSNRGCEIFVNSKPAGAIVYFNSKEWHARTDTSSVRDPGAWEVTLRRDGYKEWRQQRRLGAGESWTISATLVKQ